MDVVGRLLESTSKIWDSYIEHPFVKGIEDGTLDKQKFRYYIIQDFLYLEDYVKAFAIGIAKAKNSEMINIFSNYISAIINNEMSIHNGYIKQLNISNDELILAERELDNLSYTSYMIRVAYEESEVEILTAIMSCAYSYELIAKNMIKNNPNCIFDEFYGSWIKSYASEEYSKGNLILLDILNKLTENYTENQVKHLIEIFNVCSKYEYLFWDFSWGGK